MKAHNHNERIFYNSTTESLWDNLSKKKKKNTSLRSVPWHSTFADDSTIQQAVEEAGH